MAKEKQMNFLPEMTSEDISMTRCWRGLWVQHSNVFYQVQAHEAGVQTPKGNDFFVEPKYLFIFTVSFLK